MEKEKLRLIHGIVLFAAETLFLIVGGRFFGDIFGFCGSAVTEVFLLILTLLASVLFHVMPDKAFPFRIPSGREIAGGIAVFAGAYSLMTAVGTVQDFLFPDFTGSMGVDGLKNISPVVAVIVLAVVPAVCEELTFRGFLLSSMKSIGKPAAVIVTGLLFGIFHLNIFRLLPASVMGAAFAYIALETRSVLLPVIFHFVNNLAAVSSMLSDSAIAAEKSLPVSQTVVFCLICVVLAALLIAAGCVIFRKKRSH